MVELGCRARRPDAETSLGTGEKTMKPCQESDSSKMMDHILSGRVKAIDGTWYWTEWSITYSQQGVCTQTNFVTQEQAEADWTRRLNQARQSWGHKGSRFTETATDRPNGGRSIRFRSIRKNGKTGTLTGLLYMDRLNRTVNSSK